MHVVIAWITHVLDTGGLGSGATGMRHQHHMVHVTAFTYTTMTPVVCVLVCMK